MKFIINTIKDLNVTTLYVPKEANIKENIFKDEGINVIDYSDYDLLILYLNEPADQEECFFGIDCEPKEIVKEVKNYLLMMEII